MQIESSKSINHRVGINLPTYLYTPRYTHTHPVELMKASGGKIVYRYIYLPGIPTGQN